MKPLVESSKLKESWRCSKTMPKRPPANKWDKHKNFYLKELRESSRFTSDWKFVNESKKGESKPKGCKVHKMLIISKKVGVGARGVKALATHANSLAHPRAKLCPSWRTGGKMGVQSKEGMVTKGPQSVSSVAINANALRKCLIWSSSQFLERNCQRHILVS